MDVTDIDVAALRAAAEGATPGEWGVSDDGGGPDLIGYDEDHGDDVFIVRRERRFNTHASKDGKPDARFIAAANPAVVLALLNRLADVEGMLERTEAQIHEPGGFIDQMVVPSYSDGLRWAADVAHAEARWQWERDGRTPRVPGAQIVAQRAQVLEQTYREAADRYDQENR